MNRELQLFSLLKRRTPGYIKGNIHKVFPDLLNQNFKAENVNQKWCTDFTYLFLKDGQKRYNCSIIDLYDRSVIASLNSKTMTAELAINTLKKALSSQSIPKSGQSLNGQVLSDAQLDTSLEKLGVNDSCFLSKVVKADGANA